MRINVLTSRRADLQREISRLEEQLGAAKAELDEIVVAERVLARLTGGGAAYGAMTQDARVPPPKFYGGGEAEGRKTPTVRAMIKEALMDARQRGEPGLTPHGIREYIRKFYGRDLGQQVNSVASRMWRDLREIEKDEAGRFRLCQGNGVSPEAPEAKAEKGNDLLGFLNPNPAPDGA